VVEASPAPVRPQGRFNPRGARSREDTPARPGPARVERADVPGHDHSRHSGAPKPVGPTWNSACPSWRLRVVDHSDPRWSSDVRLGVIRPSSARNSGFLSCAALPGGDSACATFCEEDHEHR
jgi:hypothetical protein